MYGVKARPALLLGGLVLVLTGGVWLLRPPAVGTLGVEVPVVEVPVAASRAAITREDAAAPRPELAIERQPVAAGEEPGPERREPVEPSPDAAASEQGSLVVRGRVVAVDTNGLEMAPLDAQLALLVWRGNAGDSKVAEVVQGTWSAEIERPATASRLGVRSLTAGEELLVIESPGDALQLPLEGELVIRARMARASVLRVVDGQDGRELDGIQLVDGSRQDGSHPGLAFEGRRIATDLRSPIDLETSVPLALRQRRAALLVGARGYAWTQVTIDYEGGGERSFALERGGDLELALVGSERPRGAELRLRTGGEPRPLLSTAARQPTFRIDGLPAGSLRASVEVGKWFSAPIVLGEIEVEIVVGTLAQATLVLDAAPEVPPTTHAQGLVLLPRAWQARRILLLTAALLDDAIGDSESHQTVYASREDSAREGLDAFSWRFPKLQVGRYELGVRGSPFSIVVEIPPGGRDDLVLEVPPPGELVVRVVEVATGRDVATDRLSWNPKRPDGSNGGSSSTALRDPETGLYRIRAPAMSIVLRLSSWEHQPVYETVDLTGGSVQHTLRLRPAHVLAVVLRDGDTTIPFPESFFELPMPAQEGEGRVLMWGGERLARRFQVSHPGAWTFEPPAVPGYRMPERQTIEVLAGAVTTLVIALEREQR